MLRYTAKRMIY